MSSLCLYFQVHQPFRLKREYSFFEIGNSHIYEDISLNRDICNKVSKNCYIPATRLMLDLVEKFKGKFKISFSITGIALEQFQQFNPEVLELFKELYKSGCVEFIAESYYHSLAFLFSPKEFQHQVEKHKKAIKEFFGENPVTFRNTELIYSNAMALEAKNIGFKNILAEGSDNILGQLSSARPAGKLGKSCVRSGKKALSGSSVSGHGFLSKLYHPKGLPDINLLLRNYKFSDDIAFRFSQKKWKKYPLTARKYVKWLSDAFSSCAGNIHSARQKVGTGRTNAGIDAKSKGEIINLFMDYETLGEHHSAETGIFNFFEEFVSRVINKTDMEFIMPRDVSGKHKQAGEIDVPANTSWADEERDISAWTGNSMQISALNLIYKIEKNIKKTGDKDLTHLWRKLQTSDHFYYMSTKGFKDGDVHKYFNYFATPYDAYIVYCNIVNDLYETIKKRV
ncbi:MAG: glycoside hydrolase family 57 protein [Spirochaetaceae bacterium]|nr:glycoside hydrolase family 57 protein [Spirochaetaceae bacterium]